MSAEISPTDTWTVREAKAHFSEVIEKARYSGPQAITRNGKSAVIIVEASLWAEKQREGRKGGLLDFLQASPLHDADLDIKRLENGPREIGF